MTISGKGTRSDEFNKAELRIDGEPPKPHNRVKQENANAREIRLINLTIDKPRIKKAQNASPTSATNNIPNSLRQPRNTSFTNEGVKRTNDQMFKICSQTFQNRP